MNSEKKTSDHNQKLSPPSAYVAGYAKARLYDQIRANNYIKHTIIGDPALDPVIEDVVSLPPSDLHRFIEAGIEQHGKGLDDAPDSLRDFFKNLDDPPWLDYKAFKPGIRAFNLNVDLMLVAFVTGVLVEGFSTLIAKSFSMTGRVAATHRRLQQNNRQLMEIFYPGGLLRDGDGWKLSVRIRFIHARIRNLFANSTEWDHEAWGTPISAAHLGFAISVFSHKLLEYASLVGAVFNDEERESVLAVWRYTGYLMGIPETILYTDSTEAEAIYKIAPICEPPPDADSVTMANALIQAIPDVAGITDPMKKRQVIALAYRLSRALIGNQLADSFQYSKNSVKWTLLLFRIKQHFLRFFKKQQIIRLQNFSQLLSMSAYDKGGVSYRMPDHIHASKSSDY